MMSIEPFIAVKDHKEKPTYFAEIFDVERQLWIYIHSRGLLNADVQNLYRKACSSYENILLGNKELEELQEIEYSLWKLHYKHIDEFRKQTSQNFGKEETETSENNENVLKGFKLFLRESSIFYQALISKIKRFYDVSSQVDQLRLHKCRFLCHRLLVRVGDLARYVQVQEKLSSQEKNWSIAAKYYLEAAKMYPDGGNPHNQLAWLATHVGDEFLALYHCIRSLAVKEPFPDASNNLSVIFESNQSTHINSLSIEAEFNFLKPFERVRNGSSVETDFWPLLVRMTSFFFLEYNLECFSYTFGSAIRSLESLLAHDDSTLSTALESYQNVNLTRPGPYRALQLVSVLIFTIQNQTKAPETESLKLQMSFAVTFIIMGRVLGRCLKVDDKNPLLPVVLVFSEWLVEDVLGKLVKIEMEEKLLCAISYFFSLYVKLLNRLVDYLGQVRSSDQVIILWEDNEMRGYNPISQRHSSLEVVSTDQECKTDFRAQNEHRVQRIIEAAVKLANDDAQRWILYENFGGKFCMKEPMQRMTLKLEGKVAVVEEEEDIVFKPITRHNSAPLPAYLTQKERISQENAANLDANLHSSSDKSLRRASSLLIAQNRALIGALTSAGPGPAPSLSSWVLNDESIGNTGEKGILKPIDEIAFDSLSLDKQEERFGFVRSASTTESSSSTHDPHHNYLAPEPSAPLLPEDATWISGPATKVSSFIQPAPEWLLLRKDNQNHNSGMQQQQYFGSPWYPGNFYIQEATSRFDGWGYPVAVAPIQPVLHPTAPLINGFFEQRTAPYMDVRADQQMQLLQHLKEKEMRIQQDARFTYHRNL